MYLTPLCEIKNRQLTIFPPDGQTVARQDSVTKNELNKQSNK